MADLLCLKKACHLMFDNFVKCGHIFKILSPADFHKVV